MSLLAALSTGTTIAILLVVILDIFAIVLGVSFLRTRRAAKALEDATEGNETIDEGLPTPKQPKAPKLISRRDFFRKSLLASLGVFTASFGLATIAFLYPNLLGGFGSKFTVGTVSEIKSQIESTDEPFYFGQGRMYLVEYTGKGVDGETGVDYAAEGVLAEGLMPLYQRCVHLGCRVPFCIASQWFECPCHGSKYNGVGEWKDGPAPRGMDRFKMTIEGGNVIVDTSVIKLGPPRGTDTTGQNPEGPFCV